METHHFQPPTPTISNARYTREGSILCLYGAAQVCIPADENNPHFQALMAWVSQGNTIAAFEE